ncbi:TetR/AcrR family transcriptional regulator [Brevundimonas sp.]|uniref:TetR/AcrR family transcriptional regulator n=1 Tax=Brevundimonas sp. TaxID=1871086 RepID=UPI001D473B28|nr:TetR/AcrR family transcriptional regulator [Brevundimonas sp.]MBA4000176.1 TetR family transcriptional regulator [Brevundimonas sp.]
MRESSLNAPFEPVDQPADGPRLNRRQAAKVRTRQKVLDAARDLFSERGYDPATIRDIAKGAGMSTGAVFANFQDKAELFEAVLAENMERLTEVVRASAAPSGPVKARLTTALDAGYHHTLGHLPLMQAIVARSWFQPQEAEQRARGFTKGLLSVIGEVLRDGVRSGELKQDVDTRLVGDMVWDSWLTNYRGAAYDGWDEKALSERLSRQLDVILAGASAKG